MVLVTNRQADRDLGRAFSNWFLTKSSIKMHESRIYISKNWSLGPVRLVHRMPGAPGTQLAVLDGEQGTLFVRAVEIRVRTHQVPPTKG